jgi:hypothetical protein
MSEPLPHYEERKVNMAAILLLARLGEAHHTQYLELCKRSLEQWELEDHGRAVITIWRAANKWAKSGDGQLFKFLYGRIVRGGIHTQNTGLHRMTSTTTQGARP